MSEQALKKRMCNSKEKCSESALCMVFPERPNCTELAPEANSKGENLHENWQ